MSRPLSPRSYRIAIEARDLLIDVGNRLIRVGVAHWMVHPDYKAAVARHDDIMDKQIPEWGKVRRRAKKANR